MTRFEIIIEYIRHISHVGDIDVIERARVAILSDSLIDELDEVVFIRWSVHDAIIAYAPSRMHRGILRHALISQKS